MSVDQTQAVMDQYFKTMEADEDFSASYAEGVSLLLVEPGQVVRGPTAVRNYFLALHAKMLSGEQPQGLVVTDDHAYLEGASVNAEGSDPGLAYCLVYDIEGGQIVAMRGYGTLTRLVDSSAELAG